MTRNVAVVEAHPYTNLMRSGANLRGVNLTGAILTGADLTGAQADEDTQWPMGFDPVAAGVIFED